MTGAGLASLHRFQHPALGSRYKMKRTMSCFATLLAIGLSCSAALTTGEELTIRGTVRTEKGKQAGGVAVGSIWDFEVNQPPDDTRTDSKGSFKLAVETYGKPVAVLALDVEQRLGGLACVDPERERGKAIEIELRPVTRVFGKLNSPELGRTPQWTNGYVYVRCGFARVRIGKCTSFEAEFSFLLPEGQYEIDFYGTDVQERVEKYDVRGTEMDLGTIDLAATELAKLYGKAAPELTVSAARGIEAGMRLEDLRGKYVLLEFWGHWRQPCVSGSLPRLMDLQQRFANRKDDFLILAFHDDSVKSFAELDPKLKELERGMWRGRTLPFPILLDPSGETLRNYGINGFPTTVAIDIDGRIVQGYAVSLLENYLLSTSQEVRELLTGLADDFSNHLTKAIRLKDDHAAYALVQYVTDSATDEQTRKIAKGLEKIGGNFAVRFFLGENGLKSTSSETRRLAVNALREIADPRDQFTLRALSRVASDDEDGDVRRAAQKALDALVGN